MKAEKYGVIVAALYLRVSTEEQASEGYSLAAQLNQLTEYCNKNKIVIFKTYIDEGISAKFSDEKKRPQFEQMLKDAENKLFNVIIVHKYDRFARNVELSQRVKRQLRTTGINVISITEPIEDSPVGFITEGLMELMSEYFIRNLSREVKKGINERARQGKHHGMMPYGYYTRAGEVFINDEQAQIVRLIFDLYNSGKGYTTIAAYLNKNRIPTLKGSTWRHKQVYDIIKNPKYIGKMKFNDNVFDAVFPGILPIEAWEQAQNARGNGKIYRGDNYNQYLLLGILKCGHCRGTLRLWKSHWDKSYYTCRMAAMYVNRCDHTKRYPVDEMDKEILKEIADILKSKRTKNLHIKIDDSTDIIVARKEKIVKELERIKQAYIAGAFSLEQYKKENSSREQELAEIEAIKPDQMDEQRKKEKLIKYKNIWEEFNGLTDIAERKQKLLSMLRAIYIYKDKIEFSWY